MNKLKIEANSLEEAITKASKELNCSVIDLEYRVLQNPSSGFLGFFKKTAIIEVDSKKSNQTESRNFKKSENFSKKDENLSPKKENFKNEEQKSEILGRENLSRENFRKDNPKRERRQNSKGNFNSYDIKKAIPLVEDGLKALFSTNCFEIDEIEVSKFDEKTIQIKLDGRDAALLIGKEGRRYKGLLSMLQSWISQKFGLSTRLEISEFYANQEEMIKNYLKDIIMRVKESGKAQTKPLDGILIGIALEQLRAEFPDKYVGVRNSKYGKIVVINERKPGKIDKKE